jgi:hypothetical protein
MVVPESENLRSNGRQGLQNTQHKIDGSAGI